MRLRGGTGLYTRSKWMCERESSLPAIHNQEPHFSPFRSIRASFWLFRGNTHGHYKRLIINCPVRKERKKKRENRLWAKTETLRTWGARLVLLKTWTGVRKTDTQQLENVKKNEQAAYSSFSFGRDQKSSTAIITSWHDSLIELNGIPTDILETRFGGMFQSSHVFF